MKLRIFTDGACSGNPGPGGWAALFTYSEGNRIISGNDYLTTNNRMELIAVVRSLLKILQEGWDQEEKLLDGYDEVEIHTDSAYIVNAVTKGWLVFWQQNCWKTSNNEPVKNSDLWKNLLYLLKEAKKLDKVVKFVKVKGHAGNTFNEIVDIRARKESIAAKMRAGEKYNGNIL